MTLPSREETIQQAFSNWKSTLPKCVGDPGGCDGSLVGLEHEPTCPMFGKQFATMQDGFNAGYDAALSQSAERVAELEKELAEIRHELVQCDDVKLDQSLAGIVCEVQRARERAESENQALREALTIAKDALQKIGFTEQHLPATKTARHALIAVEAASLLSEKS